jgi:hypothetical protein
MPYSPNIPNLRQQNSTSYADTLGLQLGLDRLQGETTADYLKRLEFASRLRREHPYEGSLNEVSLQLGFEPTPYVNLPSIGTSIISISIAGVKIDAHPIIPLLTFDLDSMWKWRMISEVVADVNAITPATLLAADGPSFQLARQSNSLWSFAEDIAGTLVQLANTGVVVGSESFNQTVPSYMITSGGLITFSAEVPVGTQITYNYIVANYDVVGSPVAMIGLKDPEFSSIAVDNNSALAYQIREFVQTLMRADRSYWAK